MIVRNVVPLAQSPSPALCLTLERMLAVLALSQAVAPQAALQPSTGGGLSSRIIMAAQPLAPAKLAVHIALAASLASAVPVVHAEEFIPTTTLLGYELKQQSVDGDGKTAWERNQDENRAKIAAAKAAKEEARAKMLAKAAESRARIAAEAAAKS